MTNEEKASDIVLRIQNRSSLYYDVLRANYMYDAAMDMATWKDQQMINMINKIIKWIEDNYQQYDEIGVNYCGELITDNLRKFFKTREKYI